VQRGMGLLSTASADPQIRRGDCSGAGKTRVDAEAGGRGGLSGLVRTCRRQNGLGLPPFRRDHAAGNRFHAAISLVFPRRDASTAQPDRPHAFRFRVADAFAATESQELRQGAVSCPARKPADSQSVDLGGHVAPYGGCLADVFAGGLGDPGVTRTAAPVEGDGDVISPRIGAGWVMPLVNGNKVLSCKAIDSPAMKEAMRRRNQSRPAALGGTSLGRRRPDSPI
jgi:hypothetical protein